MAVTGGQNWRLFIAIWRVKPKQSFASLTPDFVVMGAKPLRSARMTPARFSRFENATLLGDAVLAHGPVLIGEAG